MNIVEEVKKDNLINKIIKFSPDKEIYLVGGAIRDFYLEKENFDKDIIIKDNSPEKYAKDLAQKLDASFVVLDNVNKIYRLVLKDKINFIDIAKLEGNSIEEDLKRRDLTINSIAINLQKFEILDINNGIEDLKNKKIRHISEKNFQDDPLRLLRVFRFQANLGFDLDKDLEHLVKKHAQSIKNVSVERINYELLKLFGGEYATSALFSMDKSGLLEVIFPFLSEIKKIPTNSHHHLDLFHHSIETVNQIQNIYENSPQEIKQHLEQNDFGGNSRLAHLKLAGFLHDIGKPETWTIEEDTGRHRFIKHDILGSKIAEIFLKSRKFSKKQISYISNMIKSHIYPSNVVSSPELNEKIYMRFVRKMDTDAIDIIILAKADRLSAKGPAITLEIIENNINSLNDMLDFYINIKDKLKPIPKLIDGIEIMKLLNIKQSPILGKIIAKLKEAQISGDVNTKDEAIEFIKQNKS